MKDAQGRGHGPDHRSAQAEEALREAMGCGADATVLLSDRALRRRHLGHGLDVGQGHRKLGGADLIFAGKQAIDGDTAQVGPMLAAILDIPLASWARKVSFHADGKVEVERLLDHGSTRWRLRCPRSSRWSRRSTSPGCRL